LAALSQNSHQVLRTIPTRASRRLASNRVGPKLNSDDPLCSGIIGSIKARTSAKPQYFTREGEERTLNPGLRAGAEIQVRYHLADAQTEMLIAPLQSAAKPAGVRHVSRLA
jgi:hypothetical protein